MEKVEKKNNLVKYFWEVTYSHTIAYFIAGIIAVNIIHNDAFSTEIISLFMRPLDDPIIVLGGTVLQIFRGILIALIILPLRNTFLNEKYGLLKLGVIVLGFSLLSTIGPGIGSFEGYIYTKISYLDQIKFGYLESIIYLLLFIGLLWFSKKYGHKKIVIILSIVFMVLLTFSGIMGYMVAKG